MIGIYQKVHVVTSVALKSSPSFKLVLGQLAMDYSPATQIFANPELQSKRTKISNDIWNRVHRISGRDFLGPKLLHCKPPCKVPT